MTAPAPPSSEEVAPDGRRIIRLPEFTARQQVAHDIIVNAKPASTTIIGFGGAVGGSKTAWLALEALYLSMDFPGNRILVARSEFNKLVTTTLEEFTKWCPPQFIVKKSDQPPVYRDIRMAHWPPGLASRIYFRGIDDWSSLGSEQYGAVLIDEAAPQVKDMAAAMLLTRLRHKLPKVVEEAYAKRGIPNPMRYFFLVTSNPYPNHWFEKWIYHRQLEEVMDAIPGANLSVHFVPSKIADNPHLPPGYAETQRAVLTAAGLGEFAERMLEGRFDVYEGRIFDHFSSTLHKWQHGEPTEKQYKRVVGGLDFGQPDATGHPTAGLVGVILHSGRLVRVAEFRQRGAGVHERLMAWMLAQQTRWGEPIHKRIEWVADRSQSGWISLASPHFNLRPSEGGPDSLDRTIGLVAARLEPDASGLPGSFYLPHLTMWEAEMLAYHRDKDTMKVVKKDDDLCFAAGTMVATPTGEVPIERLRAGDEVVLPDGSFAPVVRSWQASPCAPTLDVEFDNGTVLTVTPDQVFFAPDGRRLRADSLVSGLMVSSCMVRYNHDDRALGLQRQEVSTVSGVPDTFAPSLLASDVGPAWDSLPSPGRLGRSARSNSARDGHPPHRQRSVEQLDREPSGGSQGKAYVSPPGEAEGRSASGTDRVSALQAAVHASSRQRTPDEVLWEQLQDGGPSSARSRQRISSVLQVRSQAVCEEQVHSLQTLQGLRCVSEVRAARPQEVYDITVGHPSHRFIAGGIVVSNCACDRYLHELLEHVPVNLADAGNLMPRMAQ